MTQRRNAIIADQSPGSVCAVSGLSVEAIASLDFRTPQIAAGEHLEDAAIALLELAIALKSDTGSIESRKQLLTEFSRGADLGFGALFALERQLVPGPGEAMQ